MEHVSLASTAPPDERQHIAAELLSLFTWPIEDEYMREDFEVQSLAKERKHVIFWPRESLGREPTFNRYIHELGHALLAERHHPQFSRPYFVNNLEPELRNIYRSVFEASLDCFVEALLMRLAPGPQGQDIDKRYARTVQLIGRGRSLPNLNFIIDSGLSLASYNRYRHETGIGSGMLADTARAFLRAKPETPSLFNLQGLVRSLFKLFGQHEASLVCERGFERWRIKAVKPPAQEERI